METLKFFNHVVTKFKSTKYCHNKSGSHIKAKSIVFSEQPSFSYKSYNTFGKKDHTKDHEKSKSGKSKNSNWWKRHFESFHKNNQDNYPLAIKLTSYLIGIGTASYLGYFIDEKIIEKENLDYLLILQDIEKNITKNWLKILSDLAKLQVIENSPKLYLYSSPNQSDLLKHLTYDKHFSNNLLLIEYEKRHLETFKNSKIKLNTFVQNRIKSIDNELNNQREKLLILKQINMASYQFKLKAYSTSLKYINEAIETINNQLKFPNAQTIVDNSQAKIIIKSFLTTAYIIKASIERSKAGIHPKTLVKKDLYLALKSYNKAMKNAPDNPYILANQGYLLIDLDLPDEAMTKFRDANLIKPEEANILAGMALAFHKIEMKKKKNKLEINKRNLDIAYLIFTKSLQIDCNCETLTYRGNLLKDMNKLSNAIADYTAAIDLSKYPLALYNRGLTYKILEEYDKAINDLEEVSIFYFGHENETQIIENQIKKIYELKTMSYQNRAMYI